MRIYSLTNFRLLSTISGGHKRSVRACAWKPHVQGESVLATGSFDATVGVWRRWDNYGRAGNSSAWDVGKPSHDEDGEGGQEDGNDDEEEEEEEEEWRFAVLLDGHDSEVKSVSWSPSGMLLATCARDKSIWIWEDLDDGDNNFETVAVLQEHAGDVKCVAWHPVEECLASASYDDTIRLWREDIDDWTQVGYIKRHEGTVWFIDWEAADNVPSPAGEWVTNGTDTTTSRATQWKEGNASSGPRLISCSDDRTVRVWRRQPKGQENRPSLDAMPSIIRPTGIEETWEEDAVLPRVHELAIYAVAWSKRTGLVASVGADGRIVVYEERFTEIPQSGEETETEAAKTGRTTRETEWSIIASIAGGHGIYEINHVAWAKRADRGRKQDEGKKDVKEEEVLITTGDDGSVKVWTIQGS